MIILTFLLVPLSLLCRTDFLFSSRILEGSAWTFVIECALFWSLICIHEPCQTMAFQCARRRFSNSLQACWVRWVESQRLLQTLIRYVLESLQCIIMSVFRIWNMQQTTLTQHRSPGRIIRKQRMRKMHADGCEHHPVWPMQHDMSYNHMIRRWSWKAYMY